jgi:CBS domain-containing protein
MDLAKNLKIDSVSRLHPTAPRQVAPTHTVAEAVAIMRQERVGCLLVCESGKVVGIFTERDLMLRVDHTKGQGWHKDAVRDYMTNNVVMVSARDSIATAVQKMKSGVFRHLPVDLGPGKPVGLVSIRDILAYIAEHYPAEFLNLPPDPEHEARRRWGG